MTVMTQRFLTVPEIAELLPIATATIYREIHGDRLACLKIGGKYIVPARALSVLMASAGAVGVEDDMVVEPSASPTGQPFLQMSQAAKLLRMSRWPLGREIAAGQFPAVSVGGRALVACKAIDDLEREALASMCLIDVAEWTASLRTRMEAAA